MVAPITFAIPFEEIVLETLEKVWPPLSNAKQTNSYQIICFIEEFDQPSPWVFWDIAPFDQINGHRGRKRILFPHEAETIRKSRCPEPPTPPYAQTLLQKAHELKSHLDAYPGLTQTALARELKISRVRVTQILNLLRLAPDIQQHILALPPSNTRGPITEYSLRHLASIPDHSLQILEFRRLLGAHKSVAIPLTPA